MHLRTALIGLALAGLAAATGTATAADRAVEAANFEVGAAGVYSDTEFGNADAFNLLGTVNAEVTVPLNSHLGASAAVRLGGGFGETDVGAQTIDVDTTVALAASALFYRDPNVGRVLLGYSRDHIKTKISLDDFDDSSSSNSHSYLGVLEGYLGPVTLAVNEERVFDNSLAGHEDDVFAVARWYARANVRLGLEIGLADARDNYRAGVEFQPAFLRNRGGFFTNYTRIDTDGLTGNALEVGFSYYFKAPVELVTRDRSYR
jgi:hypothetical protein